MSSRAQGPPGTPAAPRPQFPSEPFPCKEGGPHTGADEKKTGRGPLLGLDGRDPNIPHRHDLQPLPSTPTTSGQPQTVAVAAPPEAGGRPTPLSRGAAEGPRASPSRTAAPPASPGTSAPRILRDSPPPPRLLIGPENQQVSRGRGQRGSQ